MIDGILGMVIAIGLVLSIVGSWQAMNATPISGVNEDGYGAEAGGGEPLIEDRVRRWRGAWRFILAGFFCQFVGASVLALRAWGGE